MLKYNRNQIKAGADMLCLVDMLWERPDFIGNSLPQEVCRNIFRGMELVSSVRPDRLIGGLAPPEFAVLCCVELYTRHERVAVVADIAAMLGVSVPSVSRTLRGLQSKKWIDRQINEADRRSVQVTITPAGREILDKNMQRIVSKLNSVMSVFSEDEIRTISELYGKFAAAIAADEK